MILHVVDRPARPFRVVLGSRPAIALGRISYGVYLWHVLVNGLLVHYWTDLDGWPLFLISVVATVAIAWCWYRWVESPFLRLKKRLT